MMVAPLYDENGVIKGEIEIPGVLVGEVNEAVVHAAVVALMANARSGTACTKGRSDVSGGGIKPWRQKGTGRARAGSIRSPLWRGGGIVFGPQPRSYRKRLSKGVRRLALLSALRSKVQDGKFLVIEGLNVEECKTKKIAGVLRSMGIAKGEKCLLVLADPSEKIWRSSRNIPWVGTQAVQGLNVLNVLNSDKVVALQPALAKFEEAGSVA